jgi:hypothetical protein
MCFCNERASKWLLLFSRTLFARIGFKNSNLEGAQLYVRFHDNHLGR